MAEPRVRIRLEADSSNAEAGVSRTEASLGRLNTFLRDRLIATFGDVANASRIAFQAVEDFAQSEAKLGALEIRLADQGIALDEFLAKLEEVAAGTVSSADLVRSASEALIRGLPADQIVNVLSIARQQAVVTGNTVSETFAQLVRAIASASQEQLAALGINVELRSALANLAESAGTSAAELDNATRAQAALNVVLERGVPSAEALSKATSSLSDSLQKFSAGFENLKGFLAGLTVGIVELAGAIVSTLGGAITDVVATFVKLFRILADLGSKLPFVGSKFQEVGEKIEIHRARLDQLSERMLAYGRSLKTDALDLWTRALGLSSASAQDAGSRIQSLNNDFNATSSSAKAAGDSGKAGLDAIRDAAVQAAAELEATRASSDNARAGFAALGAQAVTATAQVRALTAAQFDAIAASQGVGAATQAALDAGGRLTQGGARVRLAGGGSRLTSSFGFGARSSFATISGGTFTTTRPSSSVSSDGRIGG